MKNTVFGNGLGRIVATEERTMSDVHVTYTLYSSEFQIDERHIYSVELTTTSTDGTDTVAACDISRDHDNAMKLFMLLVNEVVTSCTLRDVLEDIL